MKKMLIAAVAIAGAVVANAASINWTAANIKASGSDLSTSSYTAFLIDNAAYAYSNLGKDTVGAAVAAALKSTTLSWNTAGMGSIPTLNPKPTDSYVNPDKPTYYMVVLDAADVASAKNYLVSATKSGTVTQAGTLSIGFSSLSGLSWNSLGSTPTPTPEPTSGLLLVLGMAGLALRRRRA